jgi:hypothetical protein
MSQHNFISDLDQYLNQKINELKTNYNKTKQNNINNTTNLINKIKISKGSQNEKNKQIALLNIQLNNILNSLQIKLNNDINQIKNYVNL